MKKFGLLRNFKIAYSVALGLFFLGLSLILGGAFGIGCVVSGLAIRIAYVTAKDHHHMP